MMIRGPHLLGPEDFPFAAHLNIGDIYATFRGESKQLVADMEKASAKAGTAGAKSFGAQFTQSMKRGVGIGAGFGAGLLAFTALAKGAKLVTGAIGDAVGAATDFDAAMTKSLAIMGDVSDEMRGSMSDAAIEVGRTTVFSANQAAEAYFFLASAGLDAAQSIEALPRVAAFAQAGAFDLATATDLLTDAQSALGLTVDDVAANMDNMARVSDVLVKANTLSNATVAQFSESLTNKGAPALRLVGKEIEEGVALLAAWADQGVKGAEAGTRLDIVLRDLQKAAINNGDEFDRLGIEVFDSTGEMVAMADIIADMEVALGGMTDRGRRATLMQLGFQSKTVGATASLLGMSGAVREYERELGEAGDTTQTVAEKQLDSLAGQMELLNSEFATISLEIGTKLVPELKKLVTYIRTDGLPAIDTLASVLNLDISGLHARENARTMRDEFERLATDASFSAEQIEAAWTKAWDENKILPGMSLEKREQQVRDLMTALFQLSQAQAVMGSAAMSAAHNVDAETAAMNALTAAIKAGNEEADALAQARSVQKLTGLIREQVKLRDRAFEAGRIQEFERRNAKVIELKDERETARLGVEAFEARKRQRRVEKREVAAAQKERKAGIKEITTETDLAKDEAKKLWDLWGKDWRLHLEVDSKELMTAKQRADALWGLLKTIGGTEVLLGIRDDRPRDPPGTAGGGPTSPWAPTIVGERGPELYVPDMPGQIYNKSQVQQLLGPSRSDVYHHVDSTSAQNLAAAGFDTEGLARLLRADTTDARYRWGD